MTPAQIISIPFLFSSCIMAALALYSWKHHVGEFIGSSICAVGFALVGIAIGGWFQ